MEHEGTNDRQMIFQIDCLTPHNIQLLLVFLDPQTIIAIISTTHHKNRQQSALVTAAEVRHFVNNFLNKTDRSIYMPFYSEPHFLNIENQQLSHITSSYSSGLQHLYETSSQLIKRLKKQLGGFQFGSQAVQSVLESLTDPELPFPKLRKQDIGMHCNSAFQFFLVDKLFPLKDEQDMQETFEQLKNYLSKSWIQNGFNQKQQIEIIEEFYASWFKVNYSNYQQYLLPRNRHHNLVVLLVALIDLFVDSFSFYIQSIQDPLYALVEFNMRFCIFRNILLSLEQKLGFLFKSYSNFCKDILKKRKVYKMDVQQPQSEQFRQMTIWHCGLSKWYIYMQQLHSTNFKTFFYLLKKNNLKAIRQINSEQMHQHGAFIQLQNRLELAQFQLLQRGEIFEVHSSIQDIFDSNVEFYDQTIKEYIQYVVDISVNQYSVHWCGHSEQVLHMPYQDFQIMVVEAYQKYITQLKGLAHSVSNPSVAFDSMLNSMVSQLDKEYLKPVTLKKVISTAKVQLTKVSGNSCEYQQFLQADKLINEEMLSRNKVLDHFNSNAGISNEISYKYSIVLESEDFNNELKVSASTNASTEGERRPNHLMRLQSIRSSDSIIDETLF